jgi:hypothetical protein
MTVGSGLFPIVEPLKISGAKIEVCWQYPIPFKI